MLAVAAKFLKEMPIVKGHCDEENPWEHWVTGHWLSRDDECFCRICGEKFLKILESGMQLTKTSCGFGISEMMISLPIWWPGIRYVLMDTGNRKMEVVRPDEGRIV